MSATPVLDRIRRIEDALAEALRQQGADVENYHGDLIAFIDFEGLMLANRPAVDVTRLAKDVERALS
ncbi:hypothetical protein [Aureimonas phyllosphaerae]|uniref:Uncharacterized protein n=1 Tax=Aureimonas phyllosphaerae TaxID=1166078 RepID=A0A7W6BXI2_9HYPH|nr:hypothetical protein [Aureimonas phyllosphaerae]MBB3937899.1 hypothetical protein [Aureimonas phyllosphaerae]MBB3961928.1 hypothetical protein [Aureimonas phyllosphaerae]SFF54758.1 hypothetical protein SAMN05216566_12555 [Aureimonas phyllosphaerae]